MSAPRVALVLFQALCNHWACTPPNPTPAKGRYHTEQLFILQIAPLIFKCHQYLVWSCALFESLYLFTSLLPASLALSLSVPNPLAFLSYTSTKDLTLTLTPQSLVCPYPSTPTPLALTPLFTIGVLAVALGTYIRLDCFAALGRLFTFDLTVHPQHTLITTRFYAYVRHPAYTGSMLVVLGLALSHLTQGAWLTQCGVLRGVGGKVVWAMWWAWTVCVGVSRAAAEDGQMRKLFGREWEAYAVQVPWWFFPGIL